MSRFGRRIAAARRAMEMTQWQLAEKLGATNRAVSAWERGRTETLLASTCFALANALSVSARWIVVGDCSMTTTGDTQTLATMQ